jgi:hypothetical protein
MTDGPSATRRGPVRRVFSRLSTVHGDMAETLAALRGRETDAPLRMGGTVELGSPLVQFSAFFRVSPSRVAYCRLSSGRVMGGLLIMTKIRHSLWGAACCMLLAGAISVGVPPPATGQEPLDQERAGRHGNLAQRWADAWNSHDACGSERARPGAVPLRARDREDITSTVIKRTATVSLWPINGRQV